MSEGESMPRVCVISVPINELGRTNFRHGLETATWGFPRLRNEVAGIVSGMPVLYGTNFSVNGRRNPRIAPEEYQNGTMGDVVLAQATGPLERASSPHWPDEIQQGRIIYPVRFPLAVLASAGSIRLPDYPLELARAFHWSHNQQSTGRIIDLDGQYLDRLAVGAGLAHWPDEGTVLGETPGVDPQVYAPVGKAGPSTGAGWVADPKVRRAIERHAVDIAISHYRARGWTVSEKGKPYDLDCVRGSDYVHVEVKGTTSKAATVELTVNEVRHASEHPTELFVVSDIVLQPGDDSLATYGGVVRVFEEWRPNPSALRATRFEYQIPW